MVHTQQTFTSKAYGLYVAYAPLTGVCSFGACFEEAVNGLVGELHSVETDARPRLARKESADVVR